jgi:hypothetical protein
MLRSAASTFGVAYDPGVLLGATAFAITVASRMYPRLTQ